MEEFITLIENRKNIDTNLTYLEIIAEVTSDLELDEDDILPIILGSSLFEKIKAECATRNLLVKSESCKFGNSFSIFD